MGAIQDVLSTKPLGGGKTIIEDVQNTLRQAIMAGALVPGSKLRTEALRNEFGVGSSTVREALSRLLIEDLVTTEGQRGFRVKQISTRDFLEISEMRTLLECTALRKSMENGDDHWEARVVAAHHRLSKVENDILGRECSAQDIETWEFLNREFHNALISGCTNSWLLNFRDTLYNHSVRYIRISMAHRAIPRDVRAEHQAIFDAVMARDISEAERLMTDHIYRSVPVIEHRLSELTDEA